MTQIWALSRKENAHQSQSCCGWWEILVNKRTPGWVPSRPPCWFQLQTATHPPRCGTVDLGGQNVHPGGRAQVDKYRGIVLTDFTKRRHMWGKTIFIFSYFQSHKKHTYIHSYIQLHTYIKYIHTYIQLHTYIHTYIQLHTYIHTHIHTITYIHTHIHTYIQLHTYIKYVHTYIHTYIHTYFIDIPRWGFSVTKQL